MPWAVGRILIFFMGFPWNQKLQGMDLSRQMAGAQGTTASCTSTGQPPVNIPLTEASHTAKTKVMGRGRALVRQWEGTAK